jgi:hypothetical protein
MLSVLFLSTPNTLSGKERCWSQSDLPACGAAVSKHTVLLSSAMTLRCQLLNAPLNSTPSGGPSTPLVVCVDAHWQTERLNPGESFDPFIDVTCEIHFNQCRRSMRHLKHGRCMCSIQRVNGKHKIFKCLWTGYGSRCQAHRFERVKNCNAAGVFTLNSDLWVSRMVHHPKDIQPTWHNCEKHWSQHGPASQLNAFTPF